MEICVCFSGTVWLRIQGYNIIGIHYWDAQMGEVVGHGKLLQWNKISLWLGDHITSIEVILLIEHCHAGNWYQYNSMFENYLNLMFHLIYYMFLDL